jgi:hypothetical protein
MRLNSGSLGDLKKATLRLGNDHEVRIVVGVDQIKAVVREIGEASPSNLDQWIIYINKLHFKHYRLYKSITTLQEVFF